MSNKDKDGLLADLRRRVQKIPPLSDEPEFLQSNETLLRYLKARDWDVDEAEKAVEGTVEYRRSTRPLQVECHWCHDRPGFHSMRQVGFDELGRPVIYSCFAQATTHKNKVDDCVRHVTYLIENAKLTMKPGISTWVFVIDCTGLTLPACNPKLGYGVTQIMASHYPERLGMVICINHNPVFQGIWKAIRVFLHSNTISKMKLIRSKDKVVQTFQRYFPEELTTWLIEEISLNKRHPLPGPQATFWEKPAAISAHDPRGCPSYVTRYIDPCVADKRRKNSSGQCDHRPHPNIVDSIQGTVKEVSLTPEELAEREVARCMVGKESSAHRSVEDGDQGGIDIDAEEIEIGEAFRIPKGAASLNM
ncbi:protein real-time-like isoform X2 [Liolophura sinensis]|uniref:protein real-time-like isoform X2 n=1 Tax=Liolophura sinensis TaxID=3198878 RepID=UPI003158A269